MLKRALLFLDRSIRLPSELSWNESLSDCDEPPADIASFFAAVNLVLVASIDLGTDAGVLVIRGIERYEDDICDGENPRTTVVTIRDDADVPPVMVDAGDFCGDDGAGDAFSGPGAEMMGVAVLLSCEEVTCGEVISLASGMVNGLRSFFFLIVMTIFSNSSGVMCLSLPRLLLESEPCLCTRGLVVVRGADVDALSPLSDSMASSSIDLMLPERFGMSTV